MEPFRLIYEDKHFNKYLKNGLIVDSCILFDFLLRHYKKAGRTEREDSDGDGNIPVMLDRFLSIGCKKYITPHILAELSNLIHINTRNPSDFSQLIDLIKDKLKEYEEIPIMMWDVLNDPLVNRFGITDTGIKLSSEKNKKIILTKDGEFCNHCKYNQKLPTIHLEDLQSLFLTLQIFKK
ncbi:MAG: hypothetical protein KJ905_01850 [Nanoarchaeota archaeon]|nr:hypothetical protein [Nanoarchaeota archaeon]